MEVILDWASLGLKSIFGKMAFLKGLSYLSSGEFVEMKFLKFVESQF